MIKPWLYPDMIFNIYKKITKFDEIYKSVLKLPIQVLLINEFNKICNLFLILYSNVKVIKEKKQTFAQKIISNEGVENIK